MREEEEEEYGRVYEKVNRTELFQVCRRKGIIVPANSTRKELVDYLTGKVEPPAEANVFDTWRHGMMNFVLDYWTQLRTQLTCPAQELKTWTVTDMTLVGKPSTRKEGLPTTSIACRTCTDAQIIACVLTNPESEDKINTRRE